ncbi:hypothetical protein HMN09_00794100 [Mycena chlorophos]|uniref:F-box domain-containing protein n=1 Tax=Mycena chlorophos TaxID=658473 RepID=A0A8H6W5A6_MYCCL|nr:hypothetical protein HMN09_00794100 [Mycena chlorophos]
MSTSRPRVYVRRIRKSPASELPEDIWRCIVAFLPEPAEKVIPKLSWLNRSLYSMAMDLRYREVGWLSASRGMQQTLEKLRTNPGFAKRVRRLHFRAGFLGPAHSMSSVLSTTSSTLLGSMIEVVRQMDSVSEYTFESCDMLVDVHAQNLFIAVRKSFSDTLRILRLHARLALFPLICPGFDSLEELELVFDADKGTKRSDKILRGPVASLINNSKGTLRNLKICSASEADLSPLFVALRPCTRLRHFTLDVSFSIHRFTHPIGLARFLHNNADVLSTLRIARAKPRSTEYPSTNDQHPWNKLSGYLVVSNAALSHLTCLAMPMLHDRFDSTLNCLKRCSTTLTELYLTNYYLNSAGFQTLLGLFARTSVLQSLHLGLDFLGVGLFDMLYKQLPKLKRLYLVLPSAIVERSTSTQPAWNGPLLDAEFGDKIYPSDWGLEDFGAWDRHFISPIQEPVPRHAQPEDKEKILEDLIAKRVSSLRKLRGAGIQRTVSGVSRL